MKITHKNTGTFTRDLYIIFNKHELYSAWEDGVVQDMRILEVKDWKKVALNRDEWTKLLKQDRAHQGLLNHELCSATVNYGQHRVILMVILCDRFVYS
jgi:hypothetical protein